MGVPAIRKWVRTAHPISADEEKVYRLDFLLAASAFYHVQEFTGNPVRQFLIFDALLVAATAIPDDLVDVIGGNIPTSDIAQVITLTVKWTDVDRRHTYLEGQSRSC